MAVVILHVHKYGGVGEVTRKFKSGGLHEKNAQPDKRHKLSAFPLKVKFISPNLHGLPVSMVPQDVTFVKADEVRITS